MNMTATQKYFAELTGVGMAVIKSRLRQLVDLNSKSLLDIKATQKTLKRLGIVRTGTLADMQVFELSQVAIKQRHAALLEIGFGTVKIPEILRFEGVMAQNKEGLVTAGLLQPDSDPVERLFEHLEVPSFVRRRIKNVKIVPLQDVRVAIVSDIIRRKLRLSDERLFRIIRKCFPLRNSCLAYVNETIDVLKEDLGLREQIQRHPVLFSVPPEDLRHLCSIADYYDLDIQQMSLERPHLLCVNPEHFRLTCRLLVEYGVTTDVICQSPAIFDYDPKYVLHGLRDLCIWPGFKTAKCHKDFHLLVAAHRQATTRLRYMQHESLEDCDLSHLLTRDTTFRSCVLDVVREKDNRPCNLDGCGSVYSPTESLAAFIADRLSCQYDEALDCLRQHSIVPYISLTAIGNTISYLLDEERFTRYEVFRALPLVLHSRDSIERVLEELPGRADLVYGYDEWRRDPNFLQLVLYFAEKMASQNAAHLEVQDVI